MDMSIISVIVASIVMFIIGAVWYMVFFSKSWAKMHGMDTYTDQEMKEMSAKMAPFYGLQLAMTIISAVMLAYLMSLLPDISPFLIASIVWLGFVLPADVSGVIFGGTKSEYIFPKIGIKSGEALTRLLVAAWVISLF